MAIKGEVERQVLANGIIRKSKSSYNSPVWIVGKKCIILIKKIPYGYRLSQAYFRYQSEIKLFTVIDLRSGFHQIPIRECDLEKNVFSANNGKYEFLRLLFGLNNTPSTFQIAIDSMLLQHIDVRYYVYIQ